MFSCSIKLCLKLLCVGSGNKPNNDCFQTGFLKTLPVGHCLDKQVTCPVAETHRSVFWKCYRRCFHTHIYDLFWEMNRRLSSVVMLSCTSRFVLQSRNTFCVIVSLRGYSEVSEKLVRVDRLLLLTCGWRKRFEGHFRCWCWSVNKILMLKRRITVAERMLYGFTVIYRF